MMTAETEGLAMAVPPDGRWIQLSSQQKSGAVGAKLAPE